MATKVITQLMHLVALFIGGGLGSLCRFGVSKLSLALITTRFPLGTFIANLLSCLILGITLLYFNSKISASITLKLFIITGFCGGFSTFSAFSLETVELLKQGYYLMAILNIVASLLFGVSILYFMLKNQV